MTTCQSWHHLTSWKTLNLQHSHRQYSPLYDWQGVRLYAVITRHSHPTAPVCWQRMEPNMCAPVRWRRAPLCGAGARLMWGQCLPLFAFPSSVEAHSAMTIHAAGQQLHMSKLLPHQENINFSYLLLQYQIQDMCICLTGFESLCLKDMPLKCSLFPQRASKLNVLR